MSRVNKMANGKLMVVIASVGLTLLGVMTLVINWDRAQARANACMVIGLLRGYRQEFGEWPSDLVTVRDQIKPERRAELLEGLNGVKVRRIGSITAPVCRYELTYPSSFSTHTEVITIAVTSLPELKVRASFIPRSRDRG